MCHKDTPFRYKHHRVNVPDDVRVAVRTLAIKHGGYTNLARLLTIAECTMHELMSIGGVVQPRVLEKVRAKLKALA